MPNNFTATERLNLLNSLGQGRASAIKASDLAQTLGYPTGGNQVKLRALIKECIEIDGDLIGSTTGRPAGFFKILNFQEFEKYLNSLESRIRSDNARRTALINSWNQQNNHPTKPILNIT